MSLLRVDTLADYVDRDCCSGELRKVVTGWPEKLLAAMIAKRMQEQLEVRSVCEKMVGPVGLEPTTNRL